MDGLERAIRQVETDRRSGASQIARSVARILAEARSRNFSDAELEDLRLRLARSHPTMAAVWNAAHAADPERFLHLLQARQQRAVRHARQLLRGARLVITLSYSSSVIETLAGLKAGVIVGQSLPGGEGKRTAAVLKRSGIDARAAPDATLHSWIPAADAVLLGADAITRRGAVNKIGSRSLALVARVERCPCYVVADSSKFPLAPKPFPPPLLGPGARFEYVELSLLTRVITEAGALTPRVIERLVRAG
ncbi:MAG: hypothetical protein KatS3mg081_1302 [Gemmatimonadales bacterium]|nr:Methylthioribose-1-phosphate isomerase [bacterium HR33]GIW51947.1 MAG: hypothetical protein KatS3mg081_1302 [Gemmatimonadales bacterium]